MRQRSAPSLKGGARTGTSIPGLIEAPVPIGQGTPSYMQPDTVKGGLIGFFLVDMSHIIQAHDHITYGFIYMMLMTGPKRSNTSITLELKGRNPRDTTMYNSRQTLQLPKRLDGR